MIDGALARAGRGNVRTRVEQTCARGRSHLSVNRGVFECTGDASGVWRGTAIDSVLAVVWERELRPRSTQSHSWFREGARNAMPRCYEPLPFLTRERLPVGVALAPMLGLQAHLLDLVELVLPVPARDLLAQQLAQEAHVVTQRRMVLSHQRLPAVRRGGRGGRELLPHLRRHTRLRGGVGGGRTEGPAPRRRRAAQGRAGQAEHRVWGRHRWFVDAQL